MTEKTAAEYTRLQMARVLLLLRQCPTSAPRAKCCQNSQKINTPRMDVNRKTICIIHSSSCQSSIQTWLQHWNWNLCLKRTCTDASYFDRMLVCYTNLITGYLQGSYSSSKAKFHDFSSQSHHIPWPIVPHISVLKAHNYLICNQQKLSQYADFTISNYSVPGFLTFLFIHALHVLFEVWQNINCLFNHWHIFYPMMCNCNFAFSLTFPGQSNFLTFSSFPDLWEPCI